MAGKDQDQDQATAPVYLCLHDAILSVLVFFLSFCSVIALLWLIDSFLDGGDLLNRYFLIVPVYAIAHCLYRYSCADKRVVSFEAKPAATCQGLVIIWSLLCGLALMGAELVFRGGGSRHWTIAMIFIGVLSTALGGVVLVYGLLRMLGKPLVWKTPHDGQHPPLKTMDRFRPSGGDEADPKAIVSAPLMVQAPNVPWNIRDMMVTHLYFGMLLVIFCFAEFAAWRLELIGKFRGSVGVFIFFGLSLVLYRGFVAMLKDKRLALKLDARSGFYRASTASWLAFTLWVLVFGFLYPNLLMALRDYSLGVAALFSFVLLPVAYAIVLRLGIFVREVQGHRYLPAAQNPHPNPSFPESLTWSGRLRIVAASLLLVLLIPLATALLCAPIIVALYTLPWFSDFIGFYPALAFAILFAVAGVALTVFMFHQLNKRAQRA